MLTTAAIAPSLRPGMHAATFGGNPLAARAGVAAIEMIEQDNLLEHSRAGSANCSASGWTAIAADCPLVSEIQNPGFDDRRGIDHRREPKLCRNAWPKVCSSIARTAMCYDSCRR